MCLCFASFCFGLMCRSKSAKFPLCLSSEETVACLTNISRGMSSWKAIVVALGPCTSVVVLLLFFFFFNLSQTFEHSIARKGFYLSHSCTGVQN